MRTQCYERGPNAKQQQNRHRQNKGRRPVGYGHRISAKSEKQTRTCHWNGSVVALNSRTSAGSISLNTSPEWTGDLGGDGHVYQYVETEVGWRGLVLEIYQTISACTHACTLHALLRYTLQQCGTTYVHTNLERRINTEKLWMEVFYATAAARIRWRCPIFAGKYIEPLAAATASRGVGF